MPILTITKDWASGQVLLEADLDFIKNDLETFFNATKVDDDNIQNDGITASTKIIDGSVPTSKLQSGGISTANINDNAITTVKIADSSLESNVFAADAQTAVLPSGIMWEFAGASIPSGWLFCDGSLISRTTYSALFTAIGETYGAGDSTTTFNIPDCRGRLRVGRDNMGGSAASRVTSTSMTPDGVTLGAVGGEEQHALTPSELAHHTHTITGNWSLSAGNNIVGDPLSQHNAAGAYYDHVHTISTTASTIGGSTGPGHPNVQPSVIMNVIIRT